MTQMHTRSELITFENPIINLPDLVHSLSMQCRFNGHTPVFYSVAQHCANVASYMEENMGIDDPVLLKQALLHDIGEAFVGDMTVPVQKMLGPEQTQAFRVLEFTLRAKVHDHVGVPMPGSEQDRLIHEADQELVQLEMAYFFDGTPMPIPGVVLSSLAPLDAGQIWFNVWNRA